MQITLDQLRAIMPHSGPAAVSALKPLNAAMASGGINTLKRAAAFLANVAVESGELRRMSESFDYTPEALLRQWPSHFTGAGAFGCGRTAEHPAIQSQIAEIAYGGRNGNTENGDGWKFRGRGYLQITGRRAYADCARATGMPLLERPDLLAEPDGAARSAVWFWNDKNLNHLADEGDFLAIVKKINGGLTGLGERQAYYAHALEILS